MNIRKRTILTILGTTCIVMLVGGIFGYFTFLNSYERLEILDIQSDAKRLLSTLDHETENLSSITDDWAAWDDTYDFVQDKNQEYVDTNLVDGTFESLKLNLIIYFDTQGQVVHHKAFDLENQEEIAVSKDILDFFDNHPSIFLASENLNNSGFLSADNKPIIYAIKPILTSSEEGPVKGFLLFAKNLEGDLLEKLKDVTDSEMTVLTNNDLIGPKDGTFIFLDNLNKDKLFINKVNSERIEYYSILSNYDNDPIFTIKQEKERIIYQKGLESTRNMLLAIILTSISAGVITIISLEYNLISRLSTLNNSLQKYRKDKKRNQNIRLAGNDELTDLSIEIEQTLKSLKNTEEKLNGHLDYEKLMVNISTMFINLSVNKIDGAIENVLENIGNKLGLDRCHLIHFYPDSFISENVYEWRKKGVNSFKDNLLNTNFKEFKWLFAKLIKNEPITIPNPDSLPDIALKEKARLAASRTTSVIAVPLKIKSSLIGLLTFESVAQNGKWNDQTLFFLEMTANILSNALDRKQNEGRLRQSQQFQYRLNQITKTSIEKESYSSSIRTLSKQLSSLIDSDHGWLILTNKEAPSQIYKNGKTYRPNQTELEAIDHLLEKTSKNIFIYNPGNDQGKNKDKGLEVLGKSFIAIPLLAKNQHLGIVILANEDEHFYSSLETNISQQAGPQITLAIIKIRSLDEAQQISKDLRDLRKTIVDISSELEFRRLMDTILERAVKLMNAEGGEFYIYDEKTGELETVTSINLDKDYQGKRIKIGQGAAGKAIQLKKIVNIKDYSTWNNRINAYDECKIKASISTPLIVGDRILGCIGVFNYTPDIQFGKNEQHLLTIFAQHASIAIDNAILFQKIQEMARMDEVTGLLNRRALFEIGEYEVARSIRLDRPIALAMIDLDNFKKVNDQYSHIIGDKVLKEVARLCRENVRNIDIIGRFGGDECIIVMPETNTDNAILTIERIRTVLESTTIKIDDHEFHITACFGISSHEKNPPSLEKIVEEADSAMYAAKMSGRNCIQIYQNL